MKAHCRSGFKPAISSGFFPADLKKIAAEACSYKTWEIK